MEFHKHSELLDLITKKLFKSPQRFTNRKAQPNQSLFGDLFLMISKSFMSRPCDKYENNLQYCEHKTKKHGEATNGRHKTT